MLLKTGSGLSSDLLSALQSNGILTVEALFATDAPSIIEKIPQFRRDPALLHRILNRLFAKVVVPSRTLAESYTRLLSSHSVLSTGDPVIDVRLSGGLFTGDHVEVCGISTLRTLFCHRVAAHLLKNDPDASIVYIDSGSTFRPEILVDDIGCTPDHLRRVQVLHAEKFSQLLRFFNCLQKGQLKLQTKPDLSSLVSGTSLWPRLVIVDSIYELANPLLLCTEDLVCVLGLLNHVGVTLRSIATHQRLVVLTTNECINDEPALGKMWAGSPHVRLLIKEGSASSTNEQIIQVLRSVREIK